MFDHQTQEYRLAAAPEGSPKIISSRIITFEEPITKHEGSYFISVDGTSSLANADRSLWSFAQDDFPPNTVEIPTDSDLDSQKETTYLFAFENKYYIANADSTTLFGGFNPENPTDQISSLVEASARSDGTTVFKLASLPEVGQEEIFSNQNEAQPSLS